MEAVKDKAFGFHHGDTVVRARSWLKDGLYTVLLAHEGGEPLGFLALYESYALYTEGAYGTIPELILCSSSSSINGCGGGVVGRGAAAWAIEGMA